jgi:FHS family L-fucose permease-like MFS transporter
VRLPAHISRGAQVGVAAFTVNYLVDQGVGISHSRASLMFAFCQLTFTGGRFLGAALLRFVDAAFLLSMYGFACMMCCLGVALGAGHSGVACLYMLFFFESICYPVSPRKPVASCFTEVCGGANQVAR